MDDAHYYHFFSISFQLRFVYSLSFFLFFLGEGNGPINYNILKHVGVSQWCVSLPLVWPWSHLLYALKAG